MRKTVRLISLMLCVLVLLSVISCSSENGDKNIGGDTLSKDLVSDGESSSSVITTLENSTGSSDSTDLTDSATTDTQCISSKEETTDDDTVSDDVVIGDDNISEDEVVGGDVVVGDDNKTDQDDNSSSLEGTALGRAFELAEFIDSVPNTKDIENGNKSSGNIQTATLKSNFGGAAAEVTDLSNPLNNSDYQWYLQADRLIHDSYYTFMSYGDEVISAIKKIKQTAVDNIVLLDTWVDGFTIQEAQRIKVSYDVNNDLVNIFALNTSNSWVSYYEITATANDSEKMVVEARWIDVENGEIFREYKVRYEEDKEWYVVCANHEGEFENAYSFVCHADLSSENIEYTMLTSSGDIRFYVSGDVPVYIQKQAPFDSTCYYLVYLSNNNGERIGELSANYQNGEYKDFSLSIDVYELEGWTSLVKENDLYKITLADETELVETDQWGEPNREVEGMQYSLTLNNIYHPVLNINFSVINEGMSAKTCVEKVLEQLGLTFKNADGLKQVAYSDSVNQIVGEFEYFGMNGNDDFSSEDFKNILTEYIISDYNAESILSLLGASTINKDEQIPSTEILENYDVTVTGKVRFDGETATVFAEGVSMSVVNTAGMTVGEKYGFVIALAGEFNSYVVGTTSKLFDGNSFSIDSCESSAFDVSAEGEYKLVGYFVHVNKETSEATRISDFITLVADSEQTFEVDRFDDTVKIVADAESVKYILASKSISMETQISE